MNAEHLLQHFDRVSEAPGAVVRLRGFILDLAVRGRLVDQDPRDEPASGILQQIQEEKRRLLNQGEIKKLETLEPVDVDEIPFAIPPGWEVIRMGSLARKLGAGSTPLGGKSVYQRDGIPFLRSQNIYDDGLKLSDVAFITRQVHDRMSGTNVERQDILLNITGASIGRCALVPSTFLEGNVSQHVAIVRLFVPAIREFIHLSLTSPFFQKVIDEVQVGVSREGLSMQRLRLFPMLLPPLAEQHRIVAKVDELMALCGRLEAAQAERERRRDRVVAASVQRLNQPTDDAVRFRRDAGFHLHHLARSTTRPEHTQQLRKTILNLAVRGELVPQDPRDEPVSKILERICTEKKSLSKMRGRAPNRPRVDSEVPFQCRELWQWARIEEVFTSVTDGDHLPPPKTERGIPFLVIGNVRNQSLDFGRSRFVSEDYYNQLDEIRRPRRGDVLYTLVGSYGIPVLVQDDRPFCVQRHIGILRPSKHVDARFMVRVLSSSVVFNQATACATGIAQKTVPLSGLRLMLVPIAPFAEQQRIVAKVDELMEVCDRLEAQLSTAQTYRARLLEAVLHDALAGHSSDESRAVASR